MPDSRPFPFSGFPLPGSPENRGRVRFFALGEVRLVVLSLLEEAPKHGYQLMKELSGRLGEQYQSSAGTVYPALKQLQKEGLITSRTEQGRHVYRLTKEGVRAVRSEARYIEAIWSRAAAVQESGRLPEPSAAAIASPLQEVVAAGLLAAKWSAGNSDREDSVRAILRDTAAKLRTLTKEGKL